MARKQAKRTFDARPDAVDFRDRMYVPSLTEVQERSDLNAYRQVGVPILDQGSEGACTGFGLATVAHYLLRTRDVDPDPDPISQRMFYEMAKRYDEWPGESYEGSSPRAAMKGWHKHGVCSAETWPYNAGHVDRQLTNGRALDAARRPLGAYFRVNHADLVAMHCALTDGEVLYASAIVHEGWTRVKEDGRIPPKQRILGGHAFAIVGYDSEGFWIQNSWGPNWGDGGLALLTYDDWLDNGRDVWVARLGVPVSRFAAASAATQVANAAKSADAYSFQDLRPHLISLGNDGELSAAGPYGTTADDVAEILSADFDRLTKGWKKKRLMLYAHGGLVNEASAVQRVADYCSALLDSEVYPLAFIWRTDYWSTLKNILSEALGRRRPEGILDATLDFMLDRLDDALEPLARILTGKAQWDEMKENAIRATKRSKGGARIALDHIAELRKRYKDKFEVHVVGHSAGSIFHAPLVQLLATRGTIKDGPMKGRRGLGCPIDSSTLWAPACTISLFDSTYHPLIASDTIKRFALFALTDEAEQDDHCAHIYHKSLLYLVSNAFETRPRVPLLRDGEPILGMDKFIKDNAGLQRLFQRPNADLVLSPNTLKPGSWNHATARHHADFDDDRATVTATLARILRRKSTAAAVSFKRTAQGLRRRRAILQQEPT